LIDVSDEDVVFAEKTAGGRFLLYCSTDKPAGYPIDFYSVMVDFGGDALAITVRLDTDSGPDGCWGAFDLLQVILKLNLREGLKRPSAEAGEVEQHVRAALDIEGKRIGRTVDLDRVEFEEDDEGLGYLYAVAPDPRDESLWLLDNPSDPNGEGISGEQILLIVSRIFRSASRLLPPGPASHAIGQVKREVRKALEAEVRRVKSLPASSSDHGSMGN